MSQQKQQDRSQGCSIKHKFQCEAPTKHIERQERLRKEKNELGIALSELFLGLAIQRNSASEVEIGFACHDGTYNIDFAAHTLSEQGQIASDGMCCPVKLPSGKEEQAKTIADYLICSIRDYEKKNAYKFVGAGLSSEFLELSPTTLPRMWLELDIVPVLVKDEEGGSLSAAEKTDGILGVDEMADSMARKCLAMFGPSYQPRVQVGFSNRVDVDIANRARLTSIEDYQRTVNEKTWKTALHYAAALKERKTKIAFFSATPQGGGVALMRHALIRFYHLLGVDCTSWVPKPKPEVFRIIKTNHNILQGVAGKDERLSDDQANTINDWVQTNASRFWSREGGPLRPSSEGGANVIIVDDPQMPQIINISKEIDPSRPVIFRSHIQIRSDLADKTDTPTAGVWKWLWSSVQHADLFIAHPVSAFVPSAVDRKKLAYMPATTDWLDGLNKQLSDFATGYYLHEFNTQCMSQRMNTLAYPQRDYIVQIARFDPSKGIPDVLSSYAGFRRNSTYCKNKKPERTPQLVIAGHYSVDDPDGVRVLNETQEQLDNEFSDIKDSVITMRLGPADQLLNALISNARVALQLSNSPRAKASKSKSPKLYAKVYQ
ncbi:hypothetical protein Slin15195_G084610 [Septoria linicola]|uniref:Trehalose synthase N-terminal domain-containing protein n=1 Tax=Septoria linicola TaxID=215465 RepID=A0A9Q9EM48_9PEZI|nr:hypothetical protein Slin14017_G087170 [Septoria linicola]USW55142.1 hypothetical protein Slin15195_G084610 [Septoria linicola]